MDYQSAGVDIQKADSLIKEIAKISKATQGPNVVQGIGGFGALFAPEWKNYSNPLLVSSTDGVGTKILLANAMNQFRALGIDLVAMSVNDILTLGAKPLFFLDYFAMGKLDLQIGKEIIEGICDGCQQSDCALIGGETAEMPGLYQGKDFDLAGFAVGIVDQKMVIDGKKIKTNDVVIGIASSGLHSNGFSLARKILFETPDKVDQEAIATLEKPFWNDSSETLGQTLLKPTRIYVKSIHTLIKEIEVRGIAHITGGGLPENLPRIIPQGLKIQIDRTSWDTPKIFQYLREKGNVPELDFYRTFNAGIGMAIIVESKLSQKAIEILQKSGEKTFPIGKILERKKEDPVFEFHG